MSFKLPPPSGVNLKQRGLDKAQALRYLRKEDPQVPEVPRGWVLARYQNLPLGWMKGLGNRVNNYYPKEWRILMREGGKG
jgi:NOL1/NOP2/fmu family ribosome biogenesis protein